MFGKRGRGGKREDRLSIRRLPSAPQGHSQRSTDETEHIAFPISSMINGSLAGDKSEEARSGLIYRKRLCRHPWGICILENSLPGSKSNKGGKCFFFRRHYPRGDIPPRGNNKYTHTDIHTSRWTRSASNRSTTGIVRGYEKEEVEEEENTQR